MTAPARVCALPTTTALVVTAAAVVTTLPVMTPTLVVTTAPVMVPAPADTAMPAWVSAATVDLPVVVVQDLALALDQQDDVLWLLYVLGCFLDRCEWEDWTTSFPPSNCCD